MGKIIITSKIKKGSLIQLALTNVKRDAFDVIKRELRDVLRGRAGIYALYRRGKVVRVGLGTKIFGRVKSHAKSKNIDWDTVSLFIIRKIKYLRDVETIVNRIAQPKDSLLKGRVGDEKLLMRLLKKRVSEKKKKLKKATLKKDRELHELESNIKQIESVMKRKR